MTTSYEEINRSLAGYVWVSCGHLRPGTGPLRPDDRCPTCMNHAHVLGPWIPLPEG